MGKAQRVRSRTAREKVAAQRAAARRAEVRRRFLVTGGSVAAVLAVVAGLIVAWAVQSPAQVSATAVAEPAVARMVTSVPAATFNDVGAGSAEGLTTVSGHPELTRDGKPEVLYMGGQYCPFCAAERWALTAALSRFGSFSGLRFTHSSPTDSYPDTPTLSFDHAHYTSRYLAFVPVEWYGQRADPATPMGHVYLQHPTPSEAALFGKYAGGSLPFVDIGNRYFAPGAQYLPSDLANLTWAQVAAAMHDPASTAGKDIDGAANRITAALCTLTHGQPRTVCTSPGVESASRSA